MLHTTCTHEVAPSVNQPTLTMTPKPSQDHCLSERHILLQPSVAITKRSSDPFACFSCHESSAAITCMRTWHHAMARRAHDLPHHTQQMHAIMSACTTCIFPSLMHGHFNGCNGIISVSETVALQTNLPQDTIIPLILPAAPAILSVGRRCMDEASTLSGMLESCRSLSPQTATRSQSTTTFRT